MKKHLFTFLFLLPSVLTAREINPDSVYLKPDSVSFQKLTEEKFSALAKTNAHIADSDVAFYGWMDSENIFYVKEFYRGGTFTVNIYNRSTRSKRQIAAFSGFPIEAKCSGRFIFVKRAAINAEFKPQIICIDTKTGNKNTIERTSVFADFTTTASGSVIYETNKGICEYTPSSAVEFTVIPAAAYSHIKNRGNVTIAYRSPSSRYTAVICGGGGEYSCAIISKGKAVANVSGVSSGSEGGWLDDNLFVFRKGGIGNFDVAIYDASSGSIRTLGESSLNTAITLSPSRRTIAYSVNGTAAMLTPDESRGQLLPIDGEELSFALRGDAFALIFAKRLFIVNYSSVAAIAPAWAKISENLTRLYSEAAKNKSEWDNDYSGEYFERKIKTIKSVQAEK